MHECTSIIINSFHFFQRTLFNKGFAVEGVGWGILIVQMKTSRGKEGAKPISTLTLKKISRFFKQPIEFLLIGCLVVAESVIKKVQTFL